MEPSYDDRLPGKQLSTSTEPYTSVGSSRKTRGWSAITQKHCVAGPVKVSFEPEEWPATVIRNGTEIGQKLDVVP